MWRLTLTLMVSCCCGRAGDRFTTMTFPEGAIGTIVGTNGMVSGTGFVVGSPGRIITCEHVIAVQPAFNYHYVSSGGAHLAVTLETVLRRYDVALLRLD